MNILIVSVVIINIVIALVLSLGAAPVLVWWERRIAGFIQDRLGPNRCHVGGVRLGGLIQSFADMLKLVFKEDYQPGAVKEKMFFTVAPMVVFAMAFLTYMIIPFADDLTIGGHTFMMQGLPVDLGILWFLAFAGLSVYGIILGGWASNNKFSLLGGIRAAAQVVSYEAAMGLSVISILMVYGTVHLGDMVRWQGELLFGFIPAWGVVVQPLAALLFIITSFAETNRTPFDIAEGESEIVGGFHTEYSAMRFGLFFVGEYVAMCAASALIVTLFFGGYQIPFLNTETLKENFSMIVVGIASMLPVVSYFFAGWIKKNNPWPDDGSNVRNNETKWLVNALVVMNVLVIFGAMLYFNLGLGSDGVNISIAVLQLFTFIAKLYCMNFVFIWVRWTLPRFRYDQLQDLGWKVLLPIAIANIFLTGIFVVILGA